MLGSNGIGFYRSSLKLALFSAVVSLAYFGAGGYATFFSDASETLATTLAGAGGAEARDWLDVDRYPSGLSLTTPHPTSNGAYRMLPFGAHAALPRWSGTPSPPLPLLTLPLPRAFG